MDYLPITLGIARTTGDAEGSQGGAPAPLSAEVRQKIFERDHHTCRFCGFQSAKYQDVHFLNGVPGDQRADNLATACIFCHQCFDLERVSAMRSGVLVWLPEMEQVQLHHVARAVYVARISQGSMAEAAKAAYETVIGRREVAQQRLGTDDPFILATVMKDFLGPKAYSQRDKKLEGVRLFPIDRRIIKEGDLEFNQFPQILAYWRSKDGPFSGKAPHQWKAIYARLNTLAA